MSASAIQLAPLREDLRLHETGPDRDGAPTWSIQDPIRNRFFRIGWLEFECLLRWADGDPARIADDIAANTPLAPDKSQVEDFVRFLERHQLLRPGPEGLRRLAKEANQPGWRHWRWWLHHYLFVRIPLIRPERLLTAMLPTVRPLISPLGLALIMLASLIGIILVARQWDSFTHGVMDILTPSGIAGFLLALAISKIFHELGHALVATHYGVRVAHMGVALIVLWPMLYTDTSESWKLRSARQRLAISCAGIAVELALAGLSTLAWALLDDGPLRQAMLYLATTGWILSLALNASPFMRFDGYFILSDLSDFPNLHERSGATARAWLRRKLLGWSDPDPEPLPPGIRRTLVAFALITWLYRLVVFLGIAVAVYLLFFKVLGIFLFAVEIAWFVVRPLWSELSVWWTRRKEIKTRRRLALYGTSLAVLILLTTPWAFDVNAPGVAYPERKQYIFSPFPAQLATLHPGGPVTAGTPLAQFEAPDLQARETRAEVLAHALDRRLAGLLAEDDGIDRQSAINEKLMEQLTEARGIQEEVQRLRLSAEFDGTWLDVDPLLRPGVWVGAKSQLGVLADLKSWIVDVYVEQGDIERIKIGARATFRQQGSLSSVDATVVGIDSTRNASLTHAMLDARHGGPIAIQPASTQEQQSRPVPVEALYRVRLALAEPLALPRETRGYANIEGMRKSLTWEALKGAIAVLVRESGF